MSEVMPFKEGNMSHYEGKEEEGQISITCRLQDTNNFFGTAQNKRPPKLGQIGRSKRVVEEDGTGDVPEDSMEKAPDDV